MGACILYCGADLAPRRSVTTPPRDPGAPGPHGGAPKHMGPKAHGPQRPWAPKPVGPKAHGPHPGIPWDPPWDPMGPPLGPHGPPPKIPLE